MKQLLDNLGILDSFKCRKNNILICELCVNILFSDIRIPEAKIWKTKIDKIISCFMLPVCTHFTALLKQNKLIRNELFSFYNHCKTETSIGLPSPIILEDPTPLSTTGRLTRLLIHKFIIITTSFGSTEREKTFSFYLTQVSFQFPYQLPNFVH